jgi:SPP1 gp7 family putative phage head morphogenesis protein
MAVTRTRGRLHQQAAEFDQVLLARQTAAADQMLAAWTASYRNVRTELDRLYAKIQAARDAGEVVSPAWAYQQGRLKGLLDAAKTEVHRYAADASAPAVEAQRAAIRAAEVHAGKLVQVAATDDLGVVGTIAKADPTALIRQAVGFTGDGSVLAEHLAKTLAPEVVDGIRATVLKGLLLGKGQDWFTREVSRNYAVAQSRAATIMRTETMRVYRETTRQTYTANTAALTGWVWQAHLDGATCIGCAMMDGTLHDVTETLDGHPNCRCAMLPRTKSWDELGATGLPDTRPDVPSGQSWVEAQPPHVQRALMGPAKFDAWQKGEISLQDMVAQHHSEDWGSMRTERSLKSIRANRNANSVTQYVSPPTGPAPTLPPPVTASPAPVLPEPAPVVDTGVAIAQTEPVTTTAPGAPRQVWVSPHGFTLQTGQVVTVGRGTATHRIQDMYPERDQVTLVNTRSRVVTYGKLSNVKPVERVAP